MKKKSSKDSDYHKFIKSLKKPVIELSFDTKPKAHPFILKTGNEFSYQFDAILTDINIHCFDPVFTSFTDTKKMLKEIKYPPNTQIMDLTLKIVGPITITRAKIKKSRKKRSKKL
jgi:hypothetical protein